MRWITDSNLFVQDRLKVIFAWENSQHFAPPTLVSPWNDFWGKTGEILYWWCVKATQLWIVHLLPDWLKICFNYSRALPRPAMRGTPWSSECGISMLIPQRSFISRGNHWWHHEMLSQRSWQWYNVIVQLHPL